MKRLLILLFVTLATAAATAQNLLWNVEQIDRAADDPAYAALKTTIIKKADGFVSRKPLAVTDKTITRSGDPHNYESMAIYYWPDPTKVDGLPYIVKDGAHNPEYKEYNFSALLELVVRLRYLSVAYRTTRDMKYHDAFCRQLDTWFIDDETYMYPQLLYSQIKPGHNNGLGCAAGILDAYQFVEVIESIRLVHQTKSIGRSRHRNLRAWFRELAEWIDNSEQGHGAAAFTNNIGVAHDITLYAMYSFAKKKRLANRAIANFETERIDAQIEDDGRQPRELERPRALTYSVANLQYFVDYCALTQTTSPRVNNAIEYLQQFIGNRDAFPYQEVGDWNEEITKLQFLIQRTQRLSRPSRSAEATTPIIPTDVLYLVK